MTFDPYHKWLGIAPKDQPPNHYRLLGIDLFESDPEVIDAAANRQMAYLQQRAAGQHAALSQKLLNEIAAARLCLLNPQTKAEYDARLQVPAKQPPPITPPDLTDLDASPHDHAEPLVMTDLWEEFTSLEKGVPPLQPQSHTVRFGLEPWQWAVAIGAIVFVGLVVLVFFASDDDMYVGGDAPSLQVQIAGLESKIAKWQASRDRLTALLGQLRQDKAAVLKKLDQLGIRSDSDLAKDPKGEVLARELKDILRNTALYEKKYQDYDLAILKSESRLRNIARRLAAESAGVSDAELEDLRGSMITLDESLAAENDATLPVDLDNTVEKELASYKSSQPPVVSQPKPGEDAPMIYLVTVDPPEAKLEIANVEKPATILGTGRHREIRIEKKWQKGGYLHVVASCDGYESDEKWLSPLPGSNTDVSISLKKRANAAPADNEGITAAGNVALASRGATVEGEVRDPKELNDGSIGGYAKVHLNVPCVLRFPVTYRLRQVRIKLEDSAFYRYKVEASSDGVRYEMLADRSWGEQRGWQTVDFSPRPIRTIRMTGTFDYPNQSGIRINEVDAYCLPIHETQSVTSAASGAEPAFANTNADHRAAANIRLLASDVVLLASFDSVQNGLLLVRHGGGRTSMVRSKGPQIVSGKVGKGLAIRSGQELELPGEYPAGAKPRTLGLWVKAGELLPDYRNVVSYGTNEARRIFGIIYKSTDNWRFFDMAGGMDSEVRVDQKWHHHCVTYDSRTIQYFFDGRLVASSDKRLETDSRPCVLGRWGQFVGELDELAVFSRALSPAQVLQICHLGESGQTIDTIVSSSQK